MRLLHACPPSCKRLPIDAETAGTAERRLRALELVDQMVAGGMRRLDALKTIGLARSTYYDWRRAFQRGGAKALKPSSTRPRSVRRRRWTDADDQAVLKLREEHPYMGKARLHAMLARDGLALSVSTVGRILSKAIADGRIQPASFCEGRLKPKRRRNFDGAWADRWRYGAKAQAPGELVQVDHMTYTKDGRTLKEVPADSSSPAICPTTKHMVARVFRRATANRTPRAKARALPAGHGRGHALPDRLHPGRRRQRVPCRLRARLPGRAHPAQGPAAAKAPVETAARPLGGTSSGPTGPPGSSSGTATTAPSPSPTSPPSSPTTSSSTTTCAPTRRWIAEPPTSTLSTSKTMPVPTAKVPKGPEPLHVLD